MELNLGETLISQAVFVYAKVLTLVLPRSRSLERSRTIYSQLLRLFSIH